MGKCDCHAASTEETINQPIGRITLIAPPAEMKDQELGAATPLSFVSGSKMNTQGSSLREPQLPAATTKGTRKGKDTAQLPVQMYEPF
jgi:hypothetical protein